MILSFVWTTFWDFFEARAKNVKTFVGFLGYEKTRLFAFEIYWLRASKLSWCYEWNEWVSRKLLYFVNWHSERYFNFLKSEFLKSFLYVKNQQNVFLFFFSFKNINLGDHFLLKTFYSRLNFWTTLLSKIRPNFCRHHSMSIHKIQ